MVLSDPAKSGLESNAWVDGYNYQNKDKSITISKKRICYFFHALYHSKGKKHVILHPVIVAILKYFTMLKIKNMPVLFSKYTDAKNYQKKVIYCDLVSG